jgi:hypothetical protein
VLNAFPETMLTTSPGLVNGFLKVRRLGSGIPAFSGIIIPDPENHHARVVNAGHARQNGMAWSLLSFPAP